MDLDRDRRNVRGLACRRDKQGIHQVSIQVTEATDFDLIRSCDLIRSICGTPSQAQPLFQIQAGLREKPQGYASGHAGRGRSDPSE